MAAGPFAVSEGKHLTTTQTVTYAGGTFTT